MRILPALLLAAALAAPGPAKISKDAPACPPADAKQLFVSPMGEPFRARGGDPVALWFAQADGDVSGTLEIAEFTADAARFFKRIDTNSDGELVPDEITAYERDVAPEIALYAARPEGWMRRPGDRFDMRYGGALGAGRWSFLNIPQPVSSTDGDLNRAITIGEYLAAARRRFALLDTGRTGRLTLATLPKTPAQQNAALPCRPAPLK
jgi:hypothetical protein